MSYYPSSYGAPVPVTHSMGYNGVPVGYNGAPMGYSGMGAPVVGVPSMGYNVVPSVGYPYAHNNYYSIGNRFRRLFGLAPAANVRYRSDRGTWGFMGYSRRQRYIDARTGGEVDRHGRPIFRV